MSKWELYFEEWTKVLSKELMDKAIQDLNIMGTKDLCPAFQDIFKAFKSCSYDKLKIVMLGMDPYPQKGVATGLLFANNKGTSEKNLSPSLKVIRDACIDYSVPHSTIEFDVSLESWAEQGVLLLNSALTTKIGNTGSHTMLWRPFMIDFLSRVSKAQNALVFMLFGEQAKTFIPYIDARYNWILTEKHPAYYAREKLAMPSKIFHTANNIMVNLYGEPIKFFKEEKDENREMLQDCLWSFGKSEKDGRSTFL